MVFECYSLSMHKFNNGDRFRSKFAPSEGEIIYVDEKYNGDFFYCVIWDVNPFSKFFIDAKEADLIWDPDSVVEQTLHVKTKAELDHEEAIKRLQEALDEFEANSKEDDQYDGWLPRGQENIKRPIPRLEACNHTWTAYTGFSESYEYCSKCNKKRNT